MKKRLFTVLLAAVLALAALAGCSSGKDDGTAASGQAGGSEKKSTKVVLNGGRHTGRAGQRLWSRQDHDRRPLR